MLPNKVMKRTGFARRLSPGRYAAPLLRVLR